MTRKRSRVMSPPRVFVNVRRISSVPNVDSFWRSLVRSRTRLGGEPADAHVSSRLAAIALFRWTGDERFSGPGAPRRSPREKTPVVPTTMKSAALSPLSQGSEPGHGPGTVIEPLLPHVSRYNVEPGDEGGSAGYPAPSL